MTHLACIATVPERHKSLRLALESLTPQAHIEVYPNAAWGDLPGDYGKFSWLASADCDFYFTCDDDLIYPLNYCRRMSAFADEYDAVVTLHGNSYFGADHKSYYLGAVRKYRCLDEVKEPDYVDVPGSGVTCIPRKYQKMIADALPKCEHPNMADLYLAYALKVCGLKAVVMPHAAGWLKAAQTEGRTVWSDINENGGDESPMVEMLNRVLA